MSAQQITEVNCGQGKKGHDKRNEAQSHAGVCLRGCVVSVCRAKPPMFELSSSVPWFLVRMGYVIEMPAFNGVSL